MNVLNHTEIAELYREIAKGFDAQANELPEGLEMAKVIMLRSAQVFGKLAIKHFSEAKREIDNANRS